MMQTDAMKALVRRELEAVNTGNWGVFDELIAEDYISHDPAFPEPIRGRDGLRQQFEAYRLGLGPEVEIRVDDQVAEGDTVATRWTATGTHKGEFFGVPPTGRRLEIRGISFERFAGGQIIEDWVSWDALGLMRQLGVVPEAEPARA
jgi:steroid delta-isomerase-like uncharacterized protein